jgi:NADPH:quinone reductase-like Zn-dependent oxidoreductase
VKAVLIRTFGPPDVMKIKAAERPSVPANGVLVRVRYSSVNPVDWKIRNGSLKFIHGATFPMKLGFDIAGEVEETGTAVTKFKKGDRVFGMLGYKVRGAYAEYACAEEDQLALIPGIVGFSEAAAIPLAGLTAFQALHYKGAMEDHDSVLVNGASGGVGSFAVQIAKTAGCTVTAVCSTDNVGTVSSLGADRIIDYRKQDFTKLPDRYDIIFDAVGKLTFMKIRRNLAKDGTYITTLPNKAADIAGFVLLPILSFFGYRRRLSFISVRPDGEDLGRLALLVKEEKIVPLIDRIYEMEDIAAAHAYSETGRARGKILIRMGRETT